MNDFLRMTGITKAFSGNLANDAVDFHLERGEIHAILGENGAGKTTLMNILCGLYQPQKGEIYFKGVKTKIYSPLQALRLGIAMVHLSPKLIPSLTVLANLILASGGIGELSLEENFILPVHNKHPLSALGFLRREAISNFATYCLHEFEIKAPNVRFKGKALSGGNLQRLILAREFSRDPSIIVASYPTRGLDISARDYLWHKFKQERSKGKGILLISADLEEIVALSNRVGVLYEGKLIGPIAVEEASAEKLGLFMSGGQIALTN